MPITPKFSWTESELDLQLTVAIDSSIHKNNLNVFVSDVFVKVVCPPILLQLDLMERVEEDRVDLQYSPECVKISLQKRQPRIWGKLAPMLSKNEMLQRRERSVADREKALELAQGRQLSAKAQLEKESHQALWSVESQQRNALLEMKNEFASDAAAELEAWQIETEKPPVEISAPSPTTTPIVSAVEPEKVQAPIRNLPPPRKGGVVSINFTSSAKPNLPARTSEADQMEEMRKAKLEAEIKKARRKLKPEEVSSLRGKGLKFFKTGVFQAAINAFTAIIEDDNGNNSSGSQSRSSTKAVDVDTLLAYANRAAALLKQAENPRGKQTRNLLRKCIADCSAALGLWDSCRLLQNAELLTSQLQHSIWIRRATSLAQLGDLAGAVGDFKQVESTITSKPLDSKTDEELEIERDGTHIRELYEQLRKNSASEFLKEAQNNVAEKKFALALPLFTKAILVNPGSVVSLVERSNCLLHLGHLKEAQEDCDVALAIVDESGDFADPLLKARCWEMLGHINVWTGNLPKALEWLESARSLWHVSKNEEATERIQSTIAVVKAGQRADMRRKEAESLYNRGEFEAAARIFQDVLASNTGVPLHAVLSNLAACNLSLADYKNALTNSTKALQLLESELEGKSRSVLSREVLLKHHRTTLVRKGTAEVWLGLVSDGRKSYSRAAALDPFGDNSDESNNWKAEKWVDDTIAIEKDIEAIDDFLTSQSNVAQNS